MTYVAGMSHIIHVITSELCLSCTSMPILVHIQQVNEMATPVPRHRHLDRNASNAFGSLRNATNLNKNAAARATK